AASNARRHIHGHFALDRRDGHARAQGGFGDADRKLTRDLVALAGEPRVGLHIDRDPEVSGVASEASRLAAAADHLLRARLGGGRKPDVERPRLATPPHPLAAVTRVHLQQPGAVAATAAGPRRKQALALHFTTPGAHRAGLGRLAARTRPGAVAIRARPARVELDLVRAAEHRLAQADGEGVAEVSPLASFLATGAKHVTEHVAEQVARGGAVEPARQVQALLQTRPRVVAGPRRGIAEHVVGLVDLTIALLDLRVAEMAIGMVLPRQSPKCLLDLVGARPTIHP